MVKGVTKSGGQKHDLDKFYTSPSVASWCLSFLDLNGFSRVIEPSAGDGSFSSLIPNCEAYDLLPENDSIVQQDWFDFEATRVDGVKILIVGNPPFGQQNSLAIKFINHAADFADVIAFVLPLTFMKPSVQDRLHPNLRLVVNEVLPKKSFLLYGVPVDVPSVFQVWKYDAGFVREKSVLPDLVGFTWCKKTDSPDLWVRRVGGSAGSIGSDIADKNTETHYFLKVNSGFTTGMVLKDFSALTFPFRSLSVGPRSVSRADILTELKSTGSTLVK